MSASIVENAPRELDPPHAVGSDAPATSPSRFRMRTRTVIAALAVVAVAGVLAAPAAARDASVVATAIVGEVQPVTLADATGAAPSVPVVVADDGVFDLKQQVATGARALLEERRAEQEARARAAEAAAARERREVSGSVWDRLADCESGDWDRNRQPIAGSARWDYGLTFSHGDFFEGGPNFHPRTWDSFKDADMPGHAGQATREQQIVVAERVLAAQGWGAWPVCSRKLGLR